MATRQPDRASSRFRLGGLVTCAWLLIVFTLFIAKQEGWSKLGLNDWGDFFAGVFAPVAFLWLVLGYMQQGDELRASTTALNLQAKELENSVAAQEALVNEAKRQFEQEELRRLQDEDARGLDRQERADERAARRAELQRERQERDDERASRKAELEADRKERKDEREQAARARLAQLRAEYQIEVVALDQSGPLVTNYTFHLHNRNYDLRNVSLAIEQEGVFHHFLGQWAKVRDAESVEVDTDMIPRLGHQSRARLIVRYKDGTGHVSEDSLLLAVPSGDHGARYYLEISPWPDPTSVGEESAESEILSLEAEHEAAATETNADLPRSPCD